MEWVCRMCGNNNYTPPETLGICHCSNENIIVINNKLIITLKKNKDDIWEL